MPIKLEEIEARANAATPGPWVAVEAHGFVTAPNGLDPRGDAEWYGSHLVAESCSEADKAFIAAARADIPALIEEVRRLKAVIRTGAKLCGVHGLCCEDHGKRIEFPWCECSCHEAAEAQQKSTAGLAGNPTPTKEVTHGAPVERPELGEGKEAGRAEPNTCTSAGRAEGSRPPPRAPGGLEIVTVGRVVTRARRDANAAPGCAAAAGGRRCATHYGLPLADDERCQEGRSGRPTALLERVLEGVQILATGYGRPEAAHREIWMAVAEKLAAELAEAISNGQPEEAPYVCAGCHAVGGERCAPDCIDDEIRREHEDALLSGNYDRASDDADDNYGAEDES